MREELIFALSVEDSNGIRHNVPNASYEKWEINSLGFKGREFDLEKKEGQIRVVCLGSSESFGKYESKDKEWPSQLGEKLRDLFPRVEVINASVVGLKYERTKDYVEKYLLPLKPDVLILFQRFLIFVRHSMREREGKYAQERRVKSTVKLYRLHIRTLPKLEETIERCLPGWLLINIRLWTLRSKLRRKVKKYLINKEPLGEVPGNIILEFEKHLSIFIDYLKENHIVPVLSTFPTLITPLNKDMHKNILMESRRHCIELSKDGIVDAYIKFNDAIRRIAKEQNLVFIDNDQLVPKTLEYFGDNYHFTDKGAELIAENFYNTLNRSHLLK